MLKSLGKPIVYHSTLVSATETSFKIVSTLLSKWFLKNAIFCQKAQNLVHARQYDLIQILPASDPSTYQTMFGDTLDFQCQHLQQ